VSGSEGIHQEDNFRYSLSVGMKMKPGDQMATGGVLGKASQKG
jgi:hypothetical protein